MKWSRAKTIFIYIFIFVNIFLFAVYKMNSSEGKQINTANVIAVLNNYNISVKADVFNNLPKNVKQVEAINIAGEESFIKEIMGKEYNSANGVVTADTKTLNLNSFFTEYINTSPRDKKFSGINKHNASGKVIAYLSKAGINKKNIYTERVNNSGDKFGIITGYEYDGKKIFNGQLLVTASKKGVEKIYGPFLTFTEIEKRYYSIISSETALIDYLSFYGGSYTKKVQITGINNGYFIPQNQGSVSSYAIPAYEIVFSDNKTVYLDAREDIEPEFRLLK